ncbi:hypothetical protein BGZ82_011291 [Podila clonocystis]|nr:hypothetical protein BGZ82_011291 [Podila clonocystis]
MAPPSFPIPTQASSQVLSEAAKATDSSFQLAYFPLHQRGELIRDLLAFSGAEWDEIPVDWATQKSQTPFQVLPVVYETNSSGTVLELAESQAIERYLARKYSLLGSNLWEENLVNEYYNNADAVFLSYHTRVVLAAVEVRFEEVKKFYAEVLAKFIVIHEQHIKKNGDNGHYVGGQASLADLKTSQLIDRLTILQPKGAQLPISAELTPGLWKVHQAVKSHASLAAWQSGARYQELTKNTKSRFGFTP